MILAAVMMTLITSATFANKIVAEGQTFTALGNYKIELADNPFVMKGEECKSFTISYENSPMEVTVVICKEKNCKKFVVLSDKLSVQYVCNNYYFGVEKLGKDIEAEGYKTSDAALNRAEYFHQKVLGSGQGNELENTQLIAAYFPMLVNNMAELTATR